jgi:PAS domain S-box-containing protein
MNEQHSVQPASPCEGDALRQRIADLEASLSQCHEAIATHISERRRAEEGARRAEARFRRLFDSTPDLVVTVDRQVRIVAANRAAPGAAVEEMVGRTGLQFIAPQHLDDCRHRLSRAFASGEIQAQEVRDVFGHWWNCQLVPLPNADGYIEHVMIICTDVSDRKETEQALKESEERYRLIAENVTDIVWTAQIGGLSEYLESVDPERDAANLDDLLDHFRFTFLSPSIERVLSYTVEEGLSLKPRAIFTSASYATVRDLMATDLTRERAGDADPAWLRTVELEHVARDGRRVWCELTLRYLRDKNSRIVGLEGITRDITERKNFERDLSAMMVGQQQAVARQIHDGLGQELLGLRLIAESLRKSLAEKNLPEAAPASQLAKAAEAAQNRVRDVIKGVRPVEVDPRGLMAALNDLATSTEGLAKIHCTFECENPVQVEDSHTATQLFLIAQEAVRNAVKYAAARRIFIGLAATNRDIRLWVRDDGVGFDHLAVASSGMGVRIMKHRAAVIGAALAIESRGQQGTTITCTLPAGS